VESIYEDGLSRIACACERIDLWVRLWRYATRSANCAWFYASSADASGQIFASSGGSNGNTGAAWRGRAAAARICTANSVYTQGDCYAACGRGATTDWFYSASRVYATCAANATDHSAYRWPNPAPCGDAADGLHSTSRTYAAGWFHAAYAASYRPNAGAAARSRHTACHRIHAASAADTTYNTSAGAPAGSRSYPTRRLHTPCGFHAASRIYPAGRFHPSPAAYAASNSGNTTDRRNAAGSHHDADSVHAATGFDRAGGILRGPWSGSNRSAPSNNTNNTGDRIRRQLYTTWADVAARIFCARRAIDGRTGVLIFFSVLVPPPNGGGLLTAGQ